MIRFVGQCGLQPLHRHTLSHAGCRRWVAALSDLAAARTGENRDVRSQLRFSFAEGAAFVDQSQLTPVFRYEKEEMSGRFCVAVA